jgi:hypothetical protein
MHRLPSKKSILRIRAAALLIFIKYLFATATAAFLFWSAIKKDYGILVSGLIWLAITLMISLAQWLVSARTNCPLCFAPVMESKSCAMNHRAHKFMGSYRLRVALNVLCSGKFRCPYCGEPTILKVRDRR